MRRTAMIIPLRHPHVGEREAKRLLRANQRTRSIGSARLDQRFTRLKYTAVSGTRGMLILLGLLTLRWHVLPTISAPFVALGIIFSCTALALGSTGRLSNWLALALDSVAVALVLRGSGGAGSPLLVLTLLLILQGGLLGNSTGALAGSGC